jgi:hypothetical protein
MTFTAARHKIAAYPSFPDVNRGIKQHRYFYILTKHNSVSFGETPRCRVPTASGTAGSVTGHSRGLSLRPFVAGNTAVFWCISKPFGGGNKKWKT